MVKRKSAEVHPPFLREIRSRWDKSRVNEGYPFNIPIFAGAEFELKFKSNLTVIIGENGSGKSTIVESIAENCGFNLSGGNRNHTICRNGAEKLSESLIFSWMPRMAHGFFIRSETFQEFIENIDALADESGEDIYQAYGGRSLRKRSHGEAFMATFENRFERPGIYLFDEPEASLSPTRQVEFIRILQSKALENKSQIIIATHSPLIMAIEGAQLLMIEGASIHEVDVESTEHFKTLKEFYSNPKVFLEKIQLQ